MHQSKGSIGHRKHRQAFGDGRKKGPQFRVWQKLEAARKPERKPRKGSWYSSIKDLFND